MPKYKLKLSASILHVASAILLCARICEPQVYAQEGADKPPAIVGKWTSIDRHVAMGSLYQPSHGVRKRESVVQFAQDGDRLTGYAIHAEHKQIVNQTRWKDGRTDFRKVTFADDHLIFEFDIDEWAKDAGPLAVEGQRVENKGTIRVEAVLKGDQLAGSWKMLLADGTEVFRGEWEATRAKETPSPAKDVQTPPKQETPPPQKEARQPLGAKQPLASALVRADGAAPTRGNWGHWLRYFRGPTRGTDDMVVLAVTLRPGQEPHPPHKHVEEEFLILTEGSGTWHLDGKEFAARQGDVVFAAPETMHGIRNTGDVPLTYYMLKWKSKSAASTVAVPRVAP